MTWECLDCKAIDGGYCAECVTPNEELRQLVEAWRDVMDVTDGKGNIVARNQSLARCADELEELIDDG